MSEQFDPFLPQRVDESIEQLTSTNQAGNVFRRQMHLKQDAHLISDLQKFYNPERTRYQQALQRVEERLVAQYSSQEKRATDFSAAPLRRQLLWNRWKVQQGRVKGTLNTMEIKQSSASSFTKFGGRVAMVAVILVILGSMLAVFSYAHQRTTETGGGGKITVPVEKAKPTPKPQLPIGTTLYTIPSNLIGFANLSWSADSKRVASATLSDVQIWDATTGKHLVKVQLPGGTSEWPWWLDWSPTSQEVAVATNQHILIVNGQTGHITRTYSSNATATTNTTTTSSSGTSYLTSQFPASGGFGYRSTAWSPNGNLMASALSFGPYGEVQVWNPQTGALSFTLSVDNTSYVISAVSWSSDGQYIAADAYNTQGGAGSTLPMNRVIVWSASTHQLVFQHDDSLTSSDAPIVWQPHSHNIAFVGSTSSGGNTLATLKIWDVTTGRQVKQYVGKGDMALAWSPDGKYLACDGYIGTSHTSAVIIMNADTGKTVYAYTGHYDQVHTIAWSPNGKYIVSSGGTGQAIPQKTVANVWVAE